MDFSLAFDVARRKGRHAGLPLHNDNESPSATALLVLIVVRC